MKETKPYGTVLLKAAKIMDCLSLQPDQTLQEIAKNTEMTASTAIKILETLTLMAMFKRHEQDVPLRNKIDSLCESKCGNKSI